MIKRMKRYLPIAIAYKTNHCMNTETLHIVMVCNIQLEDSYSERTLLNYKVVFITSLSHYKCDSLFNSGKINENKRM